METKKLNPAQLIIWDLDNVIYPYDGAFHIACDEAAARAAISLGLNMSVEQAVECAQRYRAAHGTSCDVFIREYHLPEAEMHRRYHEEISLDFLRPDVRLGFGFSRANVTHTILTHGSTDWAKRVLAARGLSQHFQEDHIVGIDRLGFSRKDKSRQPFQHMLAITGHAPHAALMVEDTAANLKHPKEMGMQTVLISYGTGDGDGYADRVFHSTHDFLEAYHREVGKPVQSAWRR